MILKSRFSVLIFIVFFFFSFDSMGMNLPKPWNIDTKNSSINFSILQNKSPITGAFKSFTGEINAEPDKLKESHIKIIVDMNSVSTTFGEVGNTLKTADWFNVKIFPHAIFTSTELTKTGEKTYQAKGLLTIRDKTVPIVLDFTLEEYSAVKAVVKGQGIIKRNDFNLGKGEWAKTDNLQNEITITFVLSVNR